VPVRFSQPAGKAVAKSKHRLCTSPSNCPWTRPATRLGRHVDTAFLCNAEMKTNYEHPNCNSHRWGSDQAGLSREQDNPYNITLAET